MNKNDDMQHITLHKPKKQWYKRVWVWVGIIIVILALDGILRAGNIGTSVSTSPTQTASSNNATATPTKSARTAKIGDTISVKDQTENTMDVTLVKIIDPATGVDQYTSPDGGKRFVGVQFKITNTGTNVLSEAPDNDVTIFDTNSQSYSSALNSLADCNGFGTNAKLAAGASELGCIAFQIPTASKVTKIQFTPSSGYSSSTGEWMAQ